MPFLALMMSKSLILLICSIWYICYGADKINYWLDSQRWQWRQNHKNFISPQTRKWHLSYVVILQELHQGFTLRILIIIFIFFLDNVQYVSLEDFPIQGMTDCNVDVIATHLHNLGTNVEFLTVDIQNFQNG